MTRSFELIQNETVQL